MREALRRQVVDQLKGERLANINEVFEHLKKVLGEQVVRENAYDINELWNNQQLWTHHQQRDQRGPSMPPTPSTSSATTTNNWTPLEERRPLKILPQCTDNVSKRSSHPRLEYRGSCLIADKDMDTGRSTPKSLLYACRWLFLERQVETP